MNYTNQFLIAMPSLGDPNFSQTVTHICAHSDEGAMGIVINKPLDLTLCDLFEHMDMPVEDDEAGTAPIVLGGPVETKRGFVLHQPDQDEDAWDSVLRVDDGLAVATSRDILTAIAEGRGPGPLVGGTRLRRLGARDNSRTKCWKRVAERPQ